MYYLPGGSYWRFIGWLMLGLAVYLSYGYVRSTVGKSVGRPFPTPLFLKFAALGFLLVAVGLFTIPHDSGFSDLIKKTIDPKEESHVRTLTGFTLVLVGMLIGIVGTLLGTRGEHPPTEAK
jgi:hypothetical protein